LKISKILNNLKKKKKKKKPNPTLLVVEKETGWMYLSPKTPKLKN
jgi:hypothetical protein